MKPRKIQLRERAQKMGETPDQTPLEVPTELGRPQSMKSLVAELVQNELSRYAQSTDQGTFDDEDDFLEDTDDEPGILSDYQLVQMEQEYLQEVRDYSLEDPDEEPAETGEGPLPTPPSEGGENEATDAEKPAL